MKHFNEKIEVPIKIINKEKSIKFLIKENIIQLKCLNNIKRIMFKNDHIDKKQ